MKRLWQIGNILALVFALVMNFLVAAQILNVPAINEISDKYATALTPATYAFSIWSLIYVLLVVFVVYQARDLLRQKAENVLPQMAGPLFIIASICNGLWTYVFVQDQTGLSVGILLLLTTSLYVLLWRLKIAMDNPPAKVIICVWWPLMLYTGWVTVASVVNIASWLASVGVYVSAVAANIVLVGLGLVLAVLLIKRNIREVLVACIWGIVAIGVQQIQTPSAVSTGMTAFIVAGVLLVFVAVHAYRNRHLNPFFTTMKSTQRSN